MSAKQLEQAAQATKTAFVFPGQGSQKSACSLNLQNSLVVSAIHLLKHLKRWVLICGRLHRRVKV